MNNKWIIFLVSLAAFLGPFTQTIYIPILPEVQKTFHTTPFLINQSISIYTLVLALMQMVYGPLADKIGRKKVLLLGIALYIFASLACALSPTIFLFLLFRGLQAAGVAAGSVVATAVIGDLFQGNVRGRAMGTFQLMVTLGPVVGPFIGGLIGRYEYSGLSFLLLGIGSMLILAIAFTLPETRPISNLNNLSSKTNLREMFHHSSGMLLIVLAFVAYYTYYNFMVFLPDVLHKVYGFGTEQKGWVFLPFTGFIVLGSYLSGKTMARIGAQQGLLWTMAINITTTLLFPYVALAPVSLLIIVLCIFGLSFGYSLPIQTTLLSEYYEKERATAIGAYNFSRYIGMASGPVLGSLLYDFGGMPLLYGMAALLYLPLFIWGLHNFFNLSRHNKH